MFVNDLRQYRAPDAPLALSCFELYDRIDPVAIVHRAGRKTMVQEFNSARRLLKALHRVGRQKREICGMIGRQGALSPLSLAALNCYLLHFYGRESIKSMRCSLHRFRWSELQESVGFTWLR